MDKNDQNESYSNSSSRKEGRKEGKKEGRKYKPFSAAKTLSHRPSDVTAILIQEKYI